MSNDNSGANIIINFIQIHQTLRFWWEGGGLCVCVFVCIWILCVFSVTQRR